MSSVPLIAQKPVTVDGEKEMEEESDHEFLMLLKRPNKETSYQTFISKLIAHLYFGGELFHYTPESPLTGPNAGKPGELGLKLIRPDFVQEIIRNRETREIEGYRVQWQDGRWNVIPAARIRHSKLYHPLNEDRGYPFLLAAWRAILLMKESDEWNKSVAESKGRIPGFFKYVGQGVFNDTQFKRTAEGIKEAYDKDQRESRPGVLDGDWNFIANSTSQKDVDWLDGVKMAMREIVVALGFDPALFGDEATRTLSNLEIALKMALELTILPMLDWILDEWNTYYMPMYGEARLSYNRDQIAAGEHERQVRALRTGRLRWHRRSQRGAGRAELARQGRRGGGAHSGSVRYGVHRADRRFRR
jgi:phage portal protein BeeE